ncbi:MAG: NAD-dependent epimerase/dehydratase family protein [Planctomycetia bacterium]|nr:NAD-dependent epimerase/dehydratase family protein [Planctomycetia bacterium]
MDKKERAFITGGTGFLGQNLAPFLVERGYEVVCYVRKSSHTDILEKLGATLVYGDLGDEDALAQAMDGASVVFHLAACISALSKKQMMDINCHDTEVVARAAARQNPLPKFIYVSSLAAAGPSSFSRPHTEDDTPSPISNYGHSKLAAEEALRQFAPKLEITILRPGIIFGPHDHEVRKWLVAIKLSGIFFIPALRKYRFSFIHAEDMCDAMILAAERGERLPAQKSADHPGEGIYYVAHPQNLNYFEMGKIMGKAVGRKAFVLPVSVPTMWIAGLGGEIIGRIRRKPCALNRDKCREALAGSWTCSAQKAVEQLGFKNRRSLQEQFDDAASFLRECKIS